MENTIQLKIPKNIKLNGVKYHNEAMLINKSHLILGPNGAGKTSLIETMMNIREKNNEYSFSYMQQGSLLEYDLRTSFKRLLLIGKAKDKKYFDYLVEELSFKRFCKKQPKKLSDGQRKIACLILNLSTESDFYVLDEPLNGLDKTRIEKVKKILREDERKILVISHRKEAHDIFSYRIKFDKEKNIYNEVSDIRSLKE